MATFCMASSLQVGPTQNIQLQQICEVVITLAEEMLFLWLVLVSGGSQSVADLSVGSAI